MPLDGRADTYQWRSIACRHTAKRQRERGSRIPVGPQTAGQRQPAPAWLAVLLGHVTDDEMKQKLFFKRHAYWSRQLAGKESGAIPLPSQELTWLRLVHACGLADDATSFSTSSLGSRMEWFDGFADDVDPFGGEVVSTIHQAKGMEIDAVVLLQNDPGERGATADEGGEDEGDQNI